MFLGEIIARWDYPKHLDAKATYDAARFFLRYSSATCPGVGF